MSALDSLASKAIWDLQEGGTAVCSSWRGSLPEDVLRNSQQSQLLTYVGLVLYGVQCYVKCTPYLHDSRDACTARHGTLSPRHIHAAANEAWLIRAGTETADRRVGKVTPPSALPNVGRGVRRSCGLPKMFRTRVSLQRRLGRQGIRGEGGTSPRKAARWWTAREHSGDRRGDSDWSYQRPGRKPLTNQAWVASAMKWEAKCGEGRRSASSRFLIGLLYRCTPLLKRTTGAVCYCNLLSPS